MKLSYSVKNLRRLASTPAIEIRPITILLGRNSVGKSTFLRSFPLLRQSIETKSSAPILWYGDFVDFGDFKSAVFNKKEDETIEFSFELNDYTAALNLLPSFFADEHLFFMQETREVTIEHVIVRYGIGSNSEKTGRKYIQVELPSSQSILSIEFDGERAAAGSVKLNNFDLTELLSEYMVYFPPDDLFEKSLFLKEVQEKEKASLRSVPRQRVFQRLIEKEIKERIDKRTSEKRVSSEARRILNYPFLDNAALQSLAAAETKTFQKLYKELASGKRTRLKVALDSTCQANYLFDLLNAIGKNLSEFFSTVEYIGPARARSERFYRQQELEVSEISPDGKNLPMFLASLNFFQMRDFSSWVEKTFGYGVKVHKTEGHISINLEQGGQSVNVVDTGYGVSQILPVLAQIWWMQRADKSPRQNHKTSNFNIKTLAIEQPELHLHPAHQALLADVFVESLVPNDSNSESKQYFLVETHSEALINRLGELIERGDVSSKDVHIVIFGSDDEGLLSSKVSIAEYGSDGVLKNWPFGFFNYP